MDETQVTSEEVVEESQDGNLEDTTDENQTENENSETNDDSSSDEIEISDSSETSQEDLVVIQEAMKKYNVSTTEALMKKLANQESHIGKIEAENKKMKEATTKSAEVVNKLRESGTGKQKETAETITSILEPLYSISEGERAEAKDKEYLEAFIKTNPEAEPFKEKLWEKGRRAKDVSYETLWALMEDAWLTGVSQGAEALEAKRKAGVGSSDTNSQGEKKKKRITQRQAELAKRFGNDPAEVYKS